jgi:transcriptional regulator with XRE-family HTH domain
MHDIGARLRNLRKEGRLTLTELAGRAGVSPSLVSQAERNRLSPSVSTLNALSGALGVTMAKFFEEEPPPEMVIRAGGAALAPWRVLVSEATGAAFTCFVTRLEPGQSSGVRAEGPAGCSELVYVALGSARIKWGREARDLEAGDSVYFRRTRARRVENAGSAPSVLLWVRGGGH